MPFADALAVVEEVESGRYTNIAGDPGHGTKWGITQVVYTAYRDRLGLPEQSVALISDTEVQGIYLSEYWLPSHAGDASHPLDVCVFDCAVNSGLHEAILTLQRAVGATADGQYGPDTLAAVKACEPFAAASRFYGLRDHFYENLAAARPESQKFLQGWLNRVAQERKEEGVA